MPICVIYIYTKTYNIQYMVMCINKYIHDIYVKKVCYTYKNIFLEKYVSQYIMKLFQFPIGFIYVFTACIGQYISYSLCKLNTCT